MYQLVTMVAEAEVLDQIDFGQCHLPIRANIIPLLQ